MYLRKGERLEILQALLFANGNRDKAAVMLGVSRYTIYRKLDLYESTTQNDPDFQAWEAEHQ